MTTGYWIGIDGGGTKTLGILLDVRQKCVAEVRGELDQLQFGGRPTGTPHLHQIIARPAGEREGTAS